MPFAATLHISCHLLKGESTHNHQYCPKYFVKKGITVLSFKDIIQQSIFVLPSRQRNDEFTKTTVPYLAHIHLFITPVEVGFTVKLFRTILHYH
jgi:hypothetical protein